MCFEIEFDNQRSRISSQTWEGAKNLTVNHLPLERGLAVQTWTLNRKLDGKALVTWLLDVHVSREMPKNLNVKVSISFILVWEISWIVYRKIPKISPPKLVTQKTLR